MCFLLVSASRLVLISIRRETASPQTGTSASALSYLILSRSLYRSWGTSISQFLHIC